MFRAITMLISTIFLLVLVFTDLTATQRLLIMGVVLFDAVNQWPGIFTARRAQKNDAH